MSRKAILWMGLALLFACSQDGNTPAPLPQDKNCSDGIKDGSETDVDCGGSCSPCDDRKSCIAAKDCGSRSCQGGSCQAATCTDQIKNGSETDFDCGGSCKPCNDQRACLLPSDCTSGVCQTRVCQAATCTDQVKNGTETDIDCGGDRCPACLTGQSCQQSSDCAPGLCSDSSKTCLLPQNCADLHRLAMNLPDGVYTIQPDPTFTRPPFAVYCDMTTDGGGWTLLYKLSAGVDAEPYSLWLGPPLNEGDMGTLNLNQSAGHYVSQFVATYWNANRVALKEARVAVYTGGVEQAFVQFNVAGTDRLNWYTQANIEKATWTDITTEGKNIFSIAGDQGNGRDWFINRNYGGCPFDSGWLVAGRLVGSCAWETGAPKRVAILYATGTTYHTWVDQGTGGTIASADVMAVFVR